MSDDPRHVLQRLCNEREEDYSTLSRMLGRNSSYISQFLQRGVPKRLGEEERRKLARYFGVSEALLGAPTGGSAPSGLIGVPLLPPSSASPATTQGCAEDPMPRIALHPKWLEALRPTAEGNLRIFAVEGDAMSPTLNDGDDVLVDLGDVTDALRDGIYLLPMHDVPAVRRLVLNPVDRSATIKADNPAYPEWRDCNIGDIAPIGRVIWFARRMR